MQKMKSLPSLRSRVALCMHLVCALTIFAVPACYGQKLPQTALPERHWNPFVYLTDGYAQLSMASMMQTRSNHSDLPNFMSPLTEDKRQLATEHVDQPGIVFLVVDGVQTTEFLMAGLLSLRALGSTLPAEVWHQNQLTLADCEKVLNLNAQCFPASSHPKALSLLSQAVLGTSFSSFMLYPSTYVMENSLSQPQVYEENVSSDPPMILAWHSLRKNQTLSTLTCTQCAAVWVSTMAHEKWKSFLVERRSSSMSDDTARNAAANYEDDLTRLHSTVTVTLIPIRREDVRVEFAIPRQSSVLTEDTLRIISGNRFALAGKNKLNSGLLENVSHVLRRYVADMPSTQQLLKSLSPANHHELYLLPSSTKRKALIFAGFGTSVSGFSDLLPTLMESTLALWKRLLREHSSPVATLDLIFLSSEASLAHARTLGCIALVKAHEKKGLPFCSTLRASFPKASSTLSKSRWSIYGEDEKSYINQRLPVSEGDEVRNFEQHLRDILANNFSRNYEEVFLFSGTHLPSLADLSWWLGGLAQKSCEMLTGLTLTQKDEEASERLYLTWVAGNPLHVVTQITLHRENSSYAFSLRRLIQTRSQSECLRYSGPLMLAGANSEGQDQTTSDVLLQQVVERSLSICEIAIETRLEISRRKALKRMVTLNSTMHCTKRREESPLTLLSPSSMMLSILKAQGQSSPHDSSLFSLTNEKESKLRSVLRLQLYQNIHPKAFRSVVNDDMRATAVTEALISFSRMQLKISQFPKNLYGLGIAVDRFHGTSYEFSLYDSILFAGVVVPNSAVILRGITSPFVENPRHGYLLKLLVVHELISFILARQNLHDLLGIRFKQLRSQLFETRDIIACSFLQIPCFRRKEFTSLPVTNGQLIANRKLAGLSLDQLEQFRQLVYVDSGFFPENPNMACLAIMTSVSHYRQNSGLNRDAYLYGSVFPSSAMVWGAGELSPNAYHDIKHSRVELHLEHMFNATGNPIFPAYSRIPGRSRIWLMPNLDVNILPMTSPASQHIVLAVARTDIGRQFLHMTRWLTRKNFKILPTKHSSRDMREEYKLYQQKIEDKNANKSERSESNGSKNGPEKPTDETRYNKFLHVGGVSPYKNTEVILKAWLRNAHFPKLTLISRQMAIYDISQTLQSEGQWPSNIEYHIHLEDHKLLAIMNTASIHLCPSVKESYGVYIDEARSAEALIITSNVPPMNELVTQDSGVLIGRSVAAPPRTALYPKANVTVEDIEAAVNQVLSMSIEERREMGRASRRRYEADRESFLATMSIVNKAVCEYEDIPAFLNLLE